MEVIKILGRQKMKLACDPNTQITRISASWENGECRGMTVDSQDFRKANEVVIFEFKDWNGFKDGIGIFWGRNGRNKRKVKHG